MTVFISVNDNLCAPKATFILFLTYFTSASEHPFCQGALGAQNSQSNAWQAPNSIIRLSSIDNRTSFISRSADLSCDPLSDQIFIGLGHPLNESLENEDE